MHSFLAAVLLLFAGWTLASQLAVLTGGSLRFLLPLAPTLICLVTVIYLRLLKRSRLHPPVAREDASVPLGAPAVTALLVVCLALPLLLRSWTGFWIASLGLLVYAMARKPAPRVLPSPGPVRIRRWEWAVVLLLGLSAVLLTLAVSRPNLDDAFYLSVAAFTSSHPDAPLLASDTMHIERGLPFIFPTYRFGAFEVLGGVLGHLLHLPAMDVMYRVLPPFWALVVVFSVFLLAQEMLPRRWLALGVVSLLLLLLLGEYPRGLGNFGFVRLFQGKAIFVSALLPAIFYLTARYYSPRGTAADGFLLGCAQVTAIGLSAFATLAAPVASLGALLSNAPLIRSAPRAKRWGGLAACAVPLPYVLVSAFQVGGSLANIAPVEPPSQVWTSVFGDHQQYLIAALMLAGPVLANTSLLRSRLSVPTLILFAVYLNPWLSTLISTRITAPTLYWRVVWSYPILVFSAVSICLLVECLLSERPRRPLLVLLSLAVFGMFLLATPFHTLRPGNDVGWHFAGRKVVAANYAVAEEAMRETAPGGRLLAPDAISGLISRFEEHPRLVTVRFSYTSYLALSFGRAGYLQRAVLWSFVSKPKGPDLGAAREALNSLQVATVVLPQDMKTRGRLLVLNSESFRLVQALNGYEIWVRQVPVT